MAGNAERRVARAEVAAYHGTELARLVSRVGEAIDSHRAGEIDAYEVDDLIHRYTRSARELWKFCSLIPAEHAATIIRGELPIDWWERGTPPERS